MLKRHGRFGRLVMGFDRLRVAVFVYIYLRCFTNKQKIKKNIITSIYMQQDPLKDLWPFLTMFVWDFTDGEQYGDIEQDYREEPDVRNLCAFVVLMRKHHQIVTKLMDYVCGLCIAAKIAV